MEELFFNKQNIGNLEYSLQREFLSTNRAGGYISTTITCCNTRKYHGLMVCPVKTLGDENYVLLSSMDESVIQHEQSFNLAIHRYPDSYEPKGHKYIVSFSYTPIPTIVYQVGGVTLKKELLWIHSKEQLLIRYTLLNATSSTKLRLRPFLAFRHIHSLSKANMFANGYSYPVDGGVRCRMYEEFPWLYLQLNTDNQFYSSPDWYYDFEYAKEALRGYEYHEDLLTTGFFEMDITKETPIILSCSTSEVNPRNLATYFEEELARRSVKNDICSCLKHAARQFMVVNEEKTFLTAGYQWLTEQKRDTLIALGGITMGQKQRTDMSFILEDLVRRCDDFRTPSEYDSADTPLWFFYALQQLEKRSSSYYVWEKFSESIINILRNYIKGIPSLGIHIHDNGLIWAKKEGQALTWMNAYVDGKPVNDRKGYQVEVNALWYNAIRYAMKMLNEYGDRDGLFDKLYDIAVNIKANFNKVFWVDKYRYLADSADQEGQDISIRPNQIIACSLYYKIIKDTEQSSIIDVIDRHLLTPKGLRTLSPIDPGYEGVYEGDIDQRNRAYHNGSVWIWLLRHYIKANFDIYGMNFTDKAKEMFSFFEEDMRSYGVGTVAEVYDGDPPHRPGGAISHAMGVGALLEILSMIESHEKTTVNQ